MKKQFFVSVAVLILIVVLGIFLANKDAKNNKQGAVNNAAPLLGQEFPNLGQKHIDVGSQHEAYNSNPPTSGPHYVQPANWGIYDKTLPDEQLVHNLEHGGIWISYKGIGADVKAKLEAIAKSNPGNVILEPREQNDSPIAVASWTRLLKMDSYDEQKVLDFIKANTNRSPEPISNASLMMK